MRRPSPITSSEASDVIVRVLVVGEETTLGLLGSGRFAIVTRPDVAGAVAWLGANAADCVLLDLSLPGEPLDSLARLRAAALDAPVVVLGEPGQDDLGARAVHEGAQDHLVKGEVDGQALARAIGYAIERAHYHVALAHQALHDPLTGLAN